MRKLVAGLIVGGMLASTTIVNAGSQQITAEDASHVKFTFNGVEKRVPEGYTVLKYQDRTYVPARFVVESMGGQVNWDEATNTVQITTPKQNQTNPVQELSIISDVVKKELSNSGITVQRADIVIDESGGFFEYRYASSPLNEEQLFKKYTMMASIGIGFNYPLDGVFINQYNENGSTLISTTWISAYSTKQYLENKISANEFVKSWSIINQTNSPANTKTTQPTIGCTSIKEKYRNMKEELNSRGLLDSNTFARLEQQMQEELEQSGCK